MSDQLKKYAKIISYLCLFLIISSVVFYYSTDIFDTFKKVDPWLIGICIVLQIPMIAFGGLAFKVLCLALNIKLTFKEWVGLSFIANFLNQLLPYRPGVGFRYIYMRKHYQMKMPDYIHVMLIYFILTLLVSCAFTFVGWFMISLPQRLTDIILFGAALSLFLVVLLIFLKWLLGRTANTKSELMKSLSLAMHLLLNNPVMLLCATISLLCVNTITAFIFYFVFMSTGSLIPLTDCFFLVGLIALTMIVPVTPGNIGVLETVVGTLTQMLYNNFSLGFTVTALFRASQWLPSLLFGTGFSLLLVGSLMPKFKDLKLGVRQSVD